MSSKSYIDKHLLHRKRCGYIYPSFEVMRAICKELKNRKDYEYCGWLYNKSIEKYRIKMVFKYIVNVVEQIYKEQDRLRMLSKKPRKNIEAKKAPKNTKENISANIEQLMLER